MSNPSRFGEFLQSLAPHLGSSGEYFLASGHAKADRVMELDSAGAHSLTLEQGIQGIERALADCDLPRSVQLELGQLVGLCRRAGLSNDEIQQKLKRLKELRILPES